ncbi:hypothetical protein [Robbsia sp. KACC 23696]|uniref:hypothetical protein n=1 Tax=Robbsia sp. KACC 23696 TaxID=3149231 RepID=UPI00325B0F08
MTTHDIIKNLEAEKRRASESDGIEEMTQAELENICGAGSGGFVNATWNKSF